MTPRTERLRRESLDAVPSISSERAELLTDFRHPASATAIRRELAAGRLPGPDLLPPAVAAAITEAGLYGWPARS